MKTKITLTLLLAIIVTSLMPSFGGILKPNPRYQRNIHRLMPMEQFGWYFNGNRVAVTPNYQVTFYQDDNPYTTLPLKYTNSGDSLNPQRNGHVFVQLDSGTYLPKGHTYHFTVPARTIHSIDSAGLYNEDLTITYSVPDTLYTWASNINGSYEWFQNGDTVATSNGFCMGCDFHIEFIADTPYIKLYREDACIRKTKGYHEDDFCGFLMFKLLWGGNVNFEKGVHYSAVVPAGLFHARGLREDVLNGELRMNWVGGYVPPTPDDGPKPLKCKWMKRHGYMIGEEQYWGEVWLYYDEPIELTDKAMMQLLRTEGRDTTVIEEHRPELQREGAYYVLYAKFCDQPLFMTSTNHHLTRLLEGSIVRPEGQPDVNNRDDFPDDPAGLDGVEAQNPVVRAVPGAVSILGAKAGSKVNVHGADGRMVAATDAPSPDPFIVPLPAPGVYVVAVGATVHKVVVR